MGVLDGQAVNAEITNPAFINKNQNDQMPNILGFTRTLSGATISDIQAAVNRLYTATGANDSGATGTNYTAPANTITVGQSHQNALSALAQKFDGVTGHHHSGSAGDGPILSTSAISNNPSTPLPVASGDFVGTAGGQFAWQDHQHMGVATLAASGQSPATGLVGAVLLAASGTTVLGVSGGQAITIYTPASGSAVNSIAASGSSALTGAVVIAASGTTTVTESGQTITVFSPASGTAVNTLAASGSSGLTGAVVLAASGSAVITESGQTITIFAPPTGSAVTSLAASGNSGLTGAVILQAGTGVTLSQSGQDILISSPLAAQGYIGPQLVAVTGTNTISAVHQSVQVSATAGATINMPAASSMQSSSGGNAYGLPIIVTNLSSYPLTVSGHINDTIAGLTGGFTIFQQYQSSTFYPNFSGNGWNVT